ncbi:sensor histidine kinase [Cohnella soli]|uniref:histidine kinase n=1 Tax=Cohnella soli TaxID=425005 RepID=A0ABW0I3E3_9BACL
MRLRIGPGRIRLSSKSLMTQMVVYFSLTVLTPLIIVIMISYSAFIANIEDKTKQLIQYDTNHAVESMESYYTDFTRLTVNLVKDEVLWSLLEKGRKLGPDKLYEQSENVGKIRELLSGYKYSQDYLESIALLSKSGEAYNSTSVNDLGLLIDMEKLHQSPGFQDFEERGLLRGSYPFDEQQWIHLSRINDPVRFTEHFGTLVYKIDRRMFEGVFGENPQLGSSVYVFNQSRQLLYQQGNALDLQSLLHIKETGTTDLTKDNKKYVVVSQSSNVTDWLVFEVVPYELMVKEARDLRNKSIWLVLITYGCALVITLILSRQVILPLKKMMVAMRHLGAGATLVEMEVKGPSEVKEITERFNMLNHQIRSLIADIIEEQKKAKEADLAALQAQINPHFLYNTLNLTVFLARKNKTREIETLTNSLIELLQDSLKSKRLVATLASELRLIEHYVRLHQFRTEHGIQLNIEADPDLLGVFMPKFSLQPLVENAIFHGIYPKEGPGGIHIKVERVMDTCQIRVIDDGVGIHDKPDAGLRRSVGLDNVRQRIAHYFADGQSDVQMFSKPGIGTVVVIMFSLANHDRLGDSR